MPSPRRHCSSRPYSGRRRSTLLRSRHQETLSALGFDIAVVGPGQLAVRAVPALLQSGDPASLARSLISELREHGATQLMTARRNELLATMAPIAPCVPTVN